MRLHAPNRYRGPLCGQTGHDVRVRDSDRKPVTCAKCRARLRRLGMT